jgi:hypothetical protein
MIIPEVNRSSWPRSHVTIVRWLGDQVKPIRPVQGLMFRFHKRMSVALEVSRQLAKFVLLVKR